MWWEILPSMTIITVAMGIPALATRAINRAIHDGNPVKRDYTQNEPMGVLYHYRDTQHSKPSFWQTYIKVGSWNNTQPLGSIDIFHFRRICKETELSTRPTPSLI